MEELSGDGRRFACHHHGESSSGMAALTGMTGELDGVEVVDDVSC
jgi:hypothetical protein